MRAAGPGARRFNRIQDNTGLHAKLEWLSGF